MTVKGFMYVVYIAESAHINFYACGTFFSPAWLDTIYAKREPRNLFPRVSRYFVYYPTTDTCIKHQEVVILVEGEN